MNSSVCGSMGSTLEGVQSRDTGVEAGTYGGTALQVLEVESLASRNGDVLENDVRAGSLTLGGLSSRGEGAGGALGKVRSTGGRGSRHQSSGQGGSAKQGRLDRRHGERDFI